MKLGPILIQYSDCIIYLVVLVSTLLCNVAHIRGDIDSFSFQSLLVFVCYAPYFAFLQCRLNSNTLSTFGVSVALFVSIGCVISWHFSLSAIYGSFFGIFQGIVLPFVLLPVSQVFAPESNVWLFAVVAAWTSLDYLLALSYGIAVTLPIQLYRFPLLLQPISWLGISFLDAFVIACNSLLGTFIASFRKPEALGTRCIPLVKLAGLVVGWIALATYAWYVFEGNDDGSVKVATVSPGYAFTGNLTDLFQMTHTASIAGATFIVWPEVYVSPSNLTQSCEEYVVDSVVPGLAGTGAFVVVGCLQKMGDCGLGNVAVTVSPEGAVIGTYGKQHPVSMMGEENCFLNGYRNYPIPAANLIEFPSPDTNLSFSTLICYDMDFPDSASSVADLGASLILNPSEDWSAARNHFAASVFRAVENRVAVAKCDWGWDSAIIDGMGVIRAIFDSRSINREILLAKVPLFAQDTSFNHLRQTLVFAVSLLGILCLWNHSRRKVWRVLEEQPMQARLLD